MSKRLALRRIKRVLSDPKRIIYFMDSRGFYNHLDDETYLKKFYKLSFGKELNLDKPKTFNEKLQWLKIHDRKPIYTTMVDKCEAKEYVAEKIGQEYIIPTLGVWERFDDIDFTALPDQFVLKCTHDSGGLAICKDKTTFNKEKAKKRMENSLKNNYYLRGREWPYKNVRPRIIAEEYLEDAGAGEGLTDYKFFCFNGEPKFLYVSRGLESHETAKVSFLTLDWAFAPFKRNDYREFEELPPKPKYLGQMIELAKKLSHSIPFLRVDIYEVEEKLYFSELTFFPCSGHLPWEPEEWDRKLGDWITLPADKQ